MRQRQKEENQVAKKTSIRKKLSKEQFEQLLFELAVFDFSLKNIEKSTRALKKILKDYTGAKGCTIMFIDKYNYLWKIEEKTTYPFKLGEGVAGWAAKHKKKAHIEDVRQDPRYKTLFRNKKGSIMSVPIVKDRKALGVINLTFKDKYEMAISSLDDEVMDFFIGKFGPILENIILFHEAREERNELRARKNIAKILDGKLSHRRRMEEIVKKIAEFMSIDQAAILTNSFGEIHLFAENAIAATNKATKSKIDLVALYKSKTGRKKYALTDISQDFNNSFIVGDGTGHSTIRPIYSGREIIGFILIEDSSKNAANLSAYERRFLDLTAKLLEKYFTYQLSSKKIIEEKEKWRMIFQNDADGVLLLTQNKKIIEANPKAKEIFGSKEKSLTGKDFFSLFKILDPELKSPTLTSIESVSSFRVISEKDLAKKIDTFFESDKKMLPKEYLIETSNGRFWTLMSMNATITRSHIEPFGIINIRDITKRKELEQDKDDFISIVSHELRTPLTAMKGFLSMTKGKDYGPLNQKQSKALGRIGESVDRMVDLVEDLLDSSRIELGRFYLMKEPVDMLGLTCEMVRELGPKIKEKNITVTIQGNDAWKYLRGRHPDNKTTTFVLADHDRLMQIIQNLLDNAIKYSFHKGIISIDLEERSRHVILKIKDKGVGISANDQKNLFKRFQRIHNPLSKDVYGTGLGLYITHKLVEAHGGTIGVKSRERQGTTFIVKMPVAKQLSFDLIKK